MNVRDFVRVLLTMSSLAVCAGCGSALEEPCDLEASTVQLRRLVEDTTPG